MLIHFEVSSAAYKRKSVKEILTKHVWSHQEREYIMKRMVESIFKKNSQFLWSCLWSVFWVFQTSSVLWFIVPVSYNCKKKRKPCLMRTSKIRHMNFCYLGCLILKLLFETYLILFSPISSFDAELVWGSSNMLFVMLWLAECVWTARMFKYRPAECISTAKVFVRSLHWPVFSFVPMMLYQWCLIMMLDQWNVCLLQNELHGSVM